MNTISGNAQTRRVWIDGKEIHPEKSQELFNHSPDGFNWGYGGSGPAQLALAVLLEFTDDVTAVKLHQQFKFAHVAHWPAGDFSIELDVREWVSLKSLGY